MNDTRRLVLVRHSKAESAGSGPDHERSLTARGRRDAAALGRWLADHDVVPDLVLTSSAARAGQTWTAAASELDDPPPVRREDDLYEASVAGVLTMIVSAPDAARTLVVVGHEPTTSAVALALAGAGSDGAAMAVARAGVPTSGLLVVHVTGAWSQLEVAGAVLVAQAAPRG